MCILLCRTTFAMSEFEALIAGIHNKVTALAEENQRLKADVGQLSLKCVQMQEKEQDNTYINQHNNSTNTITSKGDTLKYKANPDDIKKQIDRINQAIDRCLSLLN